jgi:hypothetical protein
MDKLKNQKMELFAQLIAKEGLSPSDACYRAGYGKERHPLLDQYHANMGCRLIKRQDIQERIATIREQESHKSTDYRNNLKDLLKRAIEFDLGKYYKSLNVTLSDGRVVSSWYLSVPFENWNPEDRVLVTGFDKAGRPTFFDKQWAVEKMMRLLGMLDASNSIDMEDTLSVFLRAGLPIAAPSKADKEIEKEINADLEG